MTCFLPLFRPRNQHQRVLKLRSRSRPGTLAVARPTAEGIKSAYKQRITNEAVSFDYRSLHSRIDCLLAAWTAERPAIGSGHHLRKTHPAPPQYSLTASVPLDRWRDGLIMKREKEGKRQSTHSCRVSTVEGGVERWKKEFLVSPTTDSLVSDLTTIVIHRTFFVPWQVEH